MKSVQAGFAKTSKVVIWAALASASLLSQPSMAFFDAQLLVGPRWAEVKGDNQSDSTRGTDMTAAAHLDPIPLIPVGFGFYYSQLSYDPNQFSTLGLKSLTGSEIGLEATAWLPMIPILTPYLKVGLPVYSDFKGSTVSTDPTTGVESDVDVTFKSSGVRLGVGAKFSLIPLVAILAEAGLGQQKLKLEKSAGVTANPKTEFDYKSTAFLVGVQVGI